MGMEIKGIQRNLSGVATNDGTMEDMQNLRMKDGAWRPMSEHVPLLDNEGEEYVNGEYQKMFIHNTPNYKHLLGVDTAGDLYYFADMNNKVIVELQPRVQIPDVKVNTGFQMQQFGNIITIVGGTSIDSYELGMLYLFWAEDGYEIYDNRYDKIERLGTSTDIHYGINPDGNCDLRTAIETSPFTGTNGEIVVSDDGDTIKITSYDCGAYPGENDNEEINVGTNFYAEANAIKLSMLDHEREKGRVTGYVMMRTALEMYDGSFIFHSRPVLCNQPMEQGNRHGDLSFIVTSGGTPIEVNDMHNTNTKGVCVSRNMSLYDGFTDHPSMVSDGAFMTRDGEDRISYRHETYEGASPLDLTYRHMFGYSGDNDAEVDSHITGFTPDGESKASGDDLIKRVAAKCIQNFTVTQQWRDRTDYKDYVVQGLCFGADVQYKPNQKIPERYKDIVRNVCVFMTQEVMGLDLESTSHMKLEDDTATGLKYPRASYHNARKTDEEIEEELEGLKNFYLIESIPIDEYNEKVDDAQWVRIELGTNGKLKNLTAQRELGVDPMSRVELFPKCSTKYNERLHIGNIEESVFRGFPIDFFRYQTDIDNYGVSSGTRWGWNSASFDTTLPTFSLDNITAKRVVAAHRHDSIHSNGGYEGIEWEFDTADMANSVIVVLKVTLRSNNTTYEIGRKHYPAQRLFAWNPMLSYPDSNAEKMTIEVYDYSSSRDSLLLGRKEFQLTSSDSLNISYYINPSFKPITFQDILVGGGYREETISEEQFEYLERRQRTANPTKMKVASVYNPIYFPLASTYSVGNDAIVGICSNSTPLSVGQFGDAPMYVFSTDGIFGLFVDSTGTIAYTNARPVSRESCNERDSITPTDGGIFFTTTEGLFAISGGNVTEVSEPIEGALTDYLNPLSPEYLKAVSLGFASPVYEGMVRCDLTFKDYIKDAILSFDNVNKELWVSNKGASPYSFVLAKGMWTRSTAEIKSFINDYPFNYLVDHNNKLRELGQEKDETSSVFMISRPIHFSKTGYKQIARLIVRGFLSSDTMTSLLLYGSVDGIKWALLGGVDRDGDTRDIGVVANSYSCKFYKIAMLGRQKKNGYLNLIETAVTESKILSQKLR